MNKMIAAAILVLGIMCFTGSLAQAGQVSQRGLSIEYDLFRRFAHEGYTAYTVNTWQPHSRQYVPRQVIVEKVTAQRILRGKVANEYFRTLSCVTLYFSVRDSFNNSMGEKVVTIENLGPQESGSFCVTLENSTENCTLKGFDFTYKDGAVEKVSLGY